MKLFKTLLALSLFSFYHFSYANDNPLILTGADRSLAFQNYLRHAPVLYLEASARRNVTFQEFFKTSINNKGILNLSPAEMDMAMKTTFVVFHGLKGMMNESSIKENGLMANHFAAFEYEARQAGISTTAMTRALDQLTDPNRSVTSIMDTLKTLDLNSNKAVLNRYHIQDLIKASDNTLPEDQEDLVEYVMGLHKDPRALTEWLNLGGMEAVMSSPTSLSLVMKRFSQANMDFRSRCDVTQMMETLFVFRDDNQIGTTQAINSSVKQNKGNFENFLKQQENSKDAATVCHQSGGKTLSELVKNIKTHGKAFFNGSKESHQSLANANTSLTTAVTAQEIVIGPCQLDQFINYVNKMDKNRFNGWLSDGYKSPTDQCNYTLNSQKLKNSKIKVRIEILRSGFILTKTFETTVETLIESIWKIKF